jgi:glyoxylase-like metal-dependent hydrolase (beta-lactamase superfamily II)
MKLISIETGNFMLDGGAMFGVVPKVLWEKAYPANEINLCNLSMRCLLVDTDNRKILIDAGMGSKQDSRFTGHYYLNGNDTLENSLRNANCSKTDITDVLLTHLHFDHCGGAVEFDEHRTGYRTTFPNATYWISKPQWEWSMNPNRREKPSFLKENIAPIEESGQLQLFTENFNLTPEIGIRLFNGHTVGLAVPLIRYQNRTYVYTTDLFPTMAHIPSSWVCGFDIQPLISLRERDYFLSEALANDYTLFFEHDLNTQCCQLTMTEKGIRGANPLPPGTCFLPQNN